VPVANAAPGRRLARDDRAEDDANQQAQNAGKPLDGATVALRRPTQVFPDPG